MKFTALNEYIRKERIYNISDLGTPLKKLDKDNQNPK